MAESMADAADCRAAAAYEAAWWEAEYRAETAEASAWRAALWACWAALRAVFAAATASRACAADLLA